MKTKKKKRCMDDNILNIIEAENIIKIDCA